MLFTSDNWTGNFGANFHIRSVAWVGAGYSRSEAILIMGGVDLGKVRLGYSYDYFQGLGSIVYRGAHEVVVTVALDKKVAKIIPTP